MLFVSPRPTPQNFPSLLRELPAKFWPIFVATITLALSIAILAAMPHPAFAQHVGDFGQSSNPVNRNAYFASGSYTLASDISGFDVMVGKTDTADPDTNFLTYTPDPPITLTIVDGAVTTYNPVDGMYPFGTNGSGIRVYGGNKVNVLGGSVASLIIEGDGELNVSGGNIGTIVGAFDSKTTITGGNFNALLTLGTATADISGGNFQYMELFGAGQHNITGGSVGILNVHNPSTNNIYGGSISSLYGEGNSVFNIYGGSTPLIQLRDNQGIANFFGDDFTAEYVGLTLTGSGDTRGFYDEFLINGILQDGTELNDLKLEIRNPAEIPNAQMRQFTFNFAVVVPEADTSVLMILAILAASGVVLVRRPLRVTWG